MNNIKKFVSKLLKNYFNEEDKKELIDILTTSLEEKIDDLVEQGSSVEEATEITLHEFGDENDVLQAFPDYIKNRPNLKIKRKNNFFFAIFAYLIIVGLSIFINLSWVFPATHWWVFVAIVLLFWPLIMLYIYLGTRR